MRVAIPQVDEKARIEDRAGGLLDDAYTWILKHEVFLDWKHKEDKSLLWIKGDPGKGKTMLLCGIINSLNAITPNTSTSFFFCQATNVKLNNASAVLRGLINMLLNSQRHIISDIQKEHQHLLDNLFDDADAFFTLKRVMKAALQHPKLRNAYLIIDALDECLARLPQLLHLIKEFSSHQKIKWIVSSRNVVSIEEILGGISQEKAMVSLELNQDSVSAAVAVYIGQKVDELSELKRFDENRRKEIKDYLSQHADGTFLWVALVCQNLKKAPYRPTKKMRDFPPGLRPLYQRMLEQAFHQDHHDACGPVLRHMLTVYEPLTLSELSSLTVEIEDLSPEEVKTVVQLCGSFLTLRAGKIYFVHQSAKDFLLSKECDPSVVSDKGITAAHHSLLSRSLSLMEDTLRYNMCQISPGTPATEVIWNESLDIIRYPCIFWIEHACDALKNPSLSARILSDEGMAFEFLKSHLLRWFEYLALARRVTGGFSSLRKLSEAVQVSIYSTQIVFAS